jgi:hypothetical protein
MTGAPYLTRDLDYLLGPAIASRIPDEATRIVKAADQLLAALHYPGEGLPPLPHLLKAAVEKLNELRQRYAERAAAHRETTAALGLREAEVRDLQNRLAALDAAEVEPAAKALLATLNADPDRIEPVDQILAWARLEIERLRHDLEAALTNKSPVIAVASPFLEGLDRNIAAGTPTATIEIVPPERARLDVALQKVGITPTEDLRGPCWLALDLLHAARARADAAELSLRKARATIDRQGNELGELRRAAGGMGDTKLRELAIEALRRMSDVGNTLARQERQIAELREAAVRPAPERDEGGYALCTSCRRHRAAGRSAVQGCSDCLWLNEGEREREDDHHALKNPFPPRLDGELPTAYQARVEAMIAAEPAFANRLRAYLEAHADMPFAAHWLTSALAGAARPASVLIGETESGSFEEPQTIRSGEELRAWLAADDGDLAAVITLPPPTKHIQNLMGQATVHQTDGTLGGWMETVRRGSLATISPTSDPAVVAQLGLQPAPGQCPKCLRHNGPDTDDCKSFYCEHCRHSYGLPEVAP